jgi:two-component system, NarL family, response regulator LiaR
MRQPEHTRSTAPVTTTGAPASTAGATEPNPTADAASIKPISVLVVDDHDSFRMGLGQMLAARGFDVVGYAADGRAALGLVEVLAPDVVVMDLHMPKLSGIETTRQGIEAAARGESMISAPVAAKLVARLRADDTRRSGDDSFLAFLSAREIEILGLLASGRANDEIADQLKISPFTVRNHISNVLRKLQVDNRTQAAAFAIRNGL